jgi:hydroxypyruvate reductase
VNGNDMNKELAQIFNAAVQAVQPAQLIEKHLKLYDEKIQLGEEIMPVDTVRNFFVAGAGKATAAMSAEVEKILGHRIEDGAVAIKTGHNLRLKYVRQIEAGHPLPDNNSVVAANEIAALIKRAHRSDVIIFLLSGGASSLMTDLPYGCTLEEIHQVFDLLLKSGASIHEMNTVRKHLSEIKGGQLIRHTNGAIVVTFIISDVIGNDLSIIGSGPTVPDPSTFDDAYSILSQYGLLEKTPTSVLNHLEKGRTKIIADTPKPGDKLFDRTRTYIIGDNSIALWAAAEEAKRLGYEPEIITGSMHGDAEVAAKEWAAKAAAHDRDKKYCLIAGGETTVKVKGSGKGGRSQQFALTAAVALQNDRHLSLLAGGTDGTDGPTDAAGAIVDGGTIAEAKSKGLEAETYLSNNDAYTFFEKAGGLLKTGPTQTNVMDIVITLIN